MESQNAPIVRPYSVIDRFAQTHEADVLLNIAYSLEGNGGKQQALIDRLHDDSQTSSTVACMGCYEKYYLARVNELQSESPS